MHFMLHMPQIMLDNDSITVTGITDNDPIFGRIKKIYHALGSIYFLVTKISVIYFKKHYYAYKVNLDQETAIFDVKFLPKVEPCLLVKKDNNNYVITRYNV